MTSKKNIHILIISNIRCVTYVAKGERVLPPKFKFKKEEIIQAALRVTRKQGKAGLTARALAEELGCSVKPIFGQFKNMEEVQQEVWKAVNQLYQDYLHEDMISKKYPPYKASGMAYIRFAKEETEFFKLLFMCDRSDNEIKTQDEQLQPIIELVQENLGLSKERAYRFHMDMWIFVHGIATMIVATYLDWDINFISRTLTDVYVALKHYYCEEEKNGCN